MDSNDLITHKGHLVNNASTLWMFIMLSYWHQAQFTVHSPRAVSEPLLLMPNEHFLLLLPNNSKTPGGFHCEVVAQNSAFVTEVSSDHGRLSNTCRRKGDMSIFSVVVVVLFCEKMKQEGAATVSCCMRSCRQQAAHVQLLSTVTSYYPCCAAHLVCHYY